ncbi:hypothetical protein K439DRAFT_1567531 [Ramaria rubella]|nr:hypothetical protein K439DRAFT_1567531 [Ramaria rubella]
MPGKQEIRNERRNRRNRRKIETTPEAFQFSDGFEDFETSIKTMVETAVVISPNVGQEHKSLFCPCPSGKPPCSSLVFMPYCELANSHNLIKPRSMILAR